MFPHKLFNNIFFKYKNILDINLDLKKDHFYKRVHASLEENDLINYNVKENLIKYAKNDTVITLELYRAINNLCHEILKCDILRMLTAGMMANYGFMLNIHDNVLYKTKNGNKVGEIKTKLFLCDNKENEMVSKSISGGRTLVRIHNYESKDINKNYNDINDYLVMLDISGMYCYIMKTHKFPYGAAYYASKIELDKYNDLIKNKNYDELLNILPEFYICECDCQPNEKDIEPGIGRHDENNKLHWDVKRRVGCYNSIDIKILLKNKGDLFEIKKLLMWKKVKRFLKNGC